MNDADRKQLAKKLMTALQAAVVEGHSSDNHRGQTTKAISFAPQLVAAILAGRKTETRRLIRPAPAAAPPIAGCTLAQPGDRLHVREPWAEVDGRILYAADGPFGVARYRPAMFMPRSASRLTLCVTGIRAERLSAMAAAAALAEGAPMAAADPVAWFTALWNALFTTPGERVEDDPFVWVIAFTPITAAGV